VKLLVTGCPRSGTTFVARVLQRLGLDVRHEDTGPDGAVSFALTVDDDEYPRGHKGPRRSATKFDVLVHLVREPLATISSMATMPELLPWFARHLDLAAWEPLDRLIDRGAGANLFAHIWCGWNDLIEAQRPALRVRVEDIDLHGLGDKTNHRAYQPFQWAALSANQESAVRERARRYGY